MKEEIFVVRKTDDNWKNDLVQLAVAYCRLPGTRLDELLVIRRAQECSSEKLCGFLGICWGPRNRTEYFSLLKINGGCKFNQYYRNGNITIPLSFLIRKVLKAAHFCAQRVRSLVIWKVDQQSAVAGFVCTCVTTGDLPMISKRFRILLFLSLAIV